jgi:release factor glutamine methyltransferase
VSGGPDAAPPDTVAQCLAWAQALGLERLDAHWLLAHHLQRPRAWLLAHGEHPVAGTAAAAFCADARRRADGVPLAYLTGWREFHGLRLAVGPAVLDPRPDTETLVDWALALLGAGPGDATAEAALASVPRPRVLDLGTGSGAVALALAAACPRARVHASDASAPALAQARANAQALGLSLHWLQGPWWRPVADAGLQPLDLVVSNPPYLAADDPHLPALRHEPRSALVPVDGHALSDLQAIIGGAGAHLAPGGWLLLEHGHDQADAVAALLQGAGFVSVQHRLDLAGHRRCTGGRWPGAAVDATRSCGPNA